MTEQAFKDHYRTLGIPPTATAEEIKKAYRRLAMQYHPDTNKAAYAETHFRDIKDAYEILSHASKRRKYDEERWLSGMSARARDHVVVTPEWLLKESIKLGKHIEQADTYRMNQYALKHYILMLLGDAHMAILLNDDDAKIKAGIIGELLKVSTRMQYRHLAETAPRLYELAGNDEQLKDRIRSRLQNAKNETLRVNILPVVIVLITALLCVLMYFYSRKS